MPLGFMDATAVWRNEAPGSGIGSSFGSIPYSNAVPGGKLNEFRFSPQNSRLGFRIDGDWKGLRFIGYNEFDFLGTSGSNAIGVTNGAFVPRLRLFWVNVRKGPVGIPRRPELEHVDPEPQGHFAIAERHLLQPGRRRELHARACRGPASRDSASWCMRRKTS